MASQRPSSTEGDWRRPGAPAERGTSGPRWRRGTLANAPRQVRRTRGYKVVLAAFGLGLLGALLVWVSSWLWPPQPADLLLIGAGYEQNLAIPHNAYGRKSLRILADLALPPDARADWGSGLLRLQRPPRIQTREQDWDEGLDQVRGRTVALYFALHGGSDSEGAYLLPDDADTNADPAAKSRLRLSSILDRLAKLPASLNKVLILDATQIGSHWGLGMLSNQFARELAKLEPRIKAIPRLVVLSASDVGQQSWALDSAGQTVFSSSMIDGLRGNAADEDGRIDVEDLYLHVRDQVEWWVGAHLQKRQTPVLLPSGDEGKKRARAIELCGAHGLNPDRAGTGGTPPATTAISNDDRDALRAAWEGYQQLRNGHHSPWILHPHKWRIYKQTLIRYDELIRAGAQGSAAELALSLDQLAHELQRGFSVELSSSQGTLTMSGLQRGTAAVDSESLRQPFEKLWEASPAEEGKLWLQLQGASPDPKGLRAGLLDLVIQRAADDPGRQLERAVRLAKAIADPASPLPVEVQELIMIERDLPGRPAPPPPALEERVALAIRLRREAERVVLTSTSQGGPSYSSQVLPWVRARMDEADALRRQGVDLLFSTVPSSWDEADAFLKKADLAYQAAQDDASQIRAAFDARDQGMESLAEYSRWIASIRPEIQPNRDAQFRKLEADFTRLWDALHRLDEHLEGPADPRLIRSSSGEGDRAGGIAGLTETVRSLLRSVVSTFEGDLRAIDESDLGSLWSEIRISLSVPFDDVRTRERLRDNLQRIESRFLRSNNQEGKTSHGLPSAEPSGPWNARESGRIQGMLALEVLGQDWFDRSGKGQPNRFARFQSQLGHLEDDPSWPETLNGIGDQIGVAFLQMASVIEQNTTEGLGEVEPKDEAALSAADRLWRQLDGSISLSSPNAPSDLYQQLLLRDLLLWQASRTLADHWYSEDPALEPYYRTAGLRFVEDARRIDPRPTPLKTSANAAQSAIERPGQFTFQGPDRLVLTSERQVEAEYRLQPDPNLPDASGVPVFWIEPGLDLKALAPEQGHRIPQPIEPKKEAPILCTLSSPKLDQSEDKPPSIPLVEHSTCTVKGLFRGQLFELETAVDLHLLPDQVVSRHSVPGGASLSVRAQDAVPDQLGSSTGAIAIVLDCSGSMGPSPGQPWTASTKYREATNALRQVLQGLSKGTSVSVWVFGQAVGFDKTVKNAEQTITRVQDPIVWDPADPSQLQRLMARVEYPALEPWNESPIVRTMMSARDDLRNVAGFKTMVVLTDGMDNRYEQDRLANPRKTPIPVAIREMFASSGIEINIVGYKVVGPEADRARAQFKVIEQLPIPGNFFEVNEAPELAKVLRRAMGKRLRYWIEQEDNVLVQGSPSEGLTTSRVGGNDRWFTPSLTPGGYKLVIDPQRRQERNIALNHGDLLLIQLDSARTGVDFRRVEFTREDYSWKPAIEKGDWRWAILQNQLQGASGLQMLCTLEKKFNRLETSLSVVRPREVWFELAPSSRPEAPFSMRWGNQSGYPAAAWTLTVPSWPASPGVSSPDRPIVRAWWNPDQDSPVSAALDRGPDFEVGSGQASSPIPLEGNNVVLESVRVEDHRVAVQPGIFEVQSCLVVRLRHTPGKPVLIRPFGLATAGAEQRFYQQAGRTTALFWPVGRDEASARLLGIHLYSLNNFKAQAERRGFSAELRDLPIPRPDDAPPQKVPIGESGLFALPFKD